MHPHPHHLPLPENEDAAPLPVDMKTIYLGGIFLILFLTAIRYASAIVMPVVLAFVMKLVLQPIQRSLEKFHVPRALAAFLILFVLIACMAVLVTALSAPATTWAQKLPTGLPKLQESLGFLNKPINTAKKLMMHAENMAQGPKVVPVVVEGSRLSDKIFTNTQLMISGLFTTILMLFFLLVSGDTFLRRLVEVLPRFKDKRQAVDISQHIERDISMYLLTITLINAGVGIITVVIMYACGIDDALLWGAVAFLLNYVPIIGPLVAAVIFFFVSLLVTPSIGTALIPAVLFLGVHLLEGTFVTPMLLARRFTLNPVLIMLSLVFWYWMWGFAGAILSMPMLAITKIICDRIQVLSPFGHFLEG
jgi:predicted PurR-regulated permease PerM